MFGRLEEAGQMKAAPFDSRCSLYVRVGSRAGLDIEDLAATAFAIGQVVTRTEVRDAIHAAFPR